MSYQAICIDPGCQGCLKVWQVYTCTPDECPVYVRIPGIPGIFFRSQFERVSTPSAPATAPPTPEAAVDPAGGLPGGVKHDAGKPRMDLLPPEALREIADVLGMGAQKYDTHNWRKGFAYSRLIAAALRHLFAWIGGENTDPESGKSHLAHAACCLLFLITFEVTKTGTDDRYASN